MKVRRIPVTVEAMEWTGRNLAVMEAYLGAAFKAFGGGKILVEGEEWAEPGDWIVRDENGRFRPYHLEEFWRLFERVYGE